MVWEKGAEALKAGETVEIPAEVEVAVPEESGVPKWCVGDNYCSSWQDGPLSWQDGPKLLSAVYPGRMVPIVLKLCHHAFQTIPNISFFNPQTNKQMQHFERPCTPCG